jgi:hypothetical protein
VAEAFRRFTKDGILRTIYKNRTKHNEKTFAQTTGVNSKKEITSPTITALKLAAGSSKPESLEKQDSKGDEL